MNNANKKIVLISDYLNLYLITLFIIFIKPKLFSDYPKTEKNINNIKYGRATFGSIFKTELYNSIACDKNIY